MDIQEIAKFLIGFAGGVPVVEALVVGLVVRAVKAVKGRLPDFTLWPIGLVASIAAVSGLRWIAGVPDDPMVVPALGAWGLAVLGKSGTKQLDELKKMIASMRAPK